MLRQLLALLLAFLLFAFRVQAQSNYPPLIMTQPQSTTITQGQAFDLQVVVGGETPLFYQWYFDGVLIAGENGANLSMTEATVSATGYYYAAITNQYGSVTSSVAFLAVTGPPAVTIQPTNSTKFAGGSATFNTVASGVGPLTYQWLFKGSSLPILANIITTAVGNGNAGFSSGGGVSTNARLNSPAGLAVDARGDFFIADAYNNVIRKVESYGNYGDFGIITTVAGNGNGGYSGDGGAATNASLNGPEGLALDAYGNLFFADQWNHVIRKLQTNGIITTVAGNGNRGYSGDGGGATSASLANPTGVAVDTHGNLFIADQANHRIRMVSTNGIITTAVGTEVGFYGAYFGDGGVATNAGLKYPFGLAVDTGGNIFIADQGNNRIRKVNTNGIITTVAGNGRFGPINNGGAATNSNLYNPYGVAVDTHGNFFIADQGNSLIERVDSNGIIRTVSGIGNGKSGQVGSYSGDGGVATNANLYFPTCVALGPYGNLFIADRGNNRVRKVNAYAGSPTLALNSVKPESAGNYQLIIANTFGSVTSSIATLTVILPLISIAPNADRSVTLNIETAPNISSRLWFATNLTPPIVWQNLSTKVAGADGTWQFVDNSPKLKTNLFRFYRCSTP